MVQSVLPLFSFHSLILFLPRSLASSRIHIVNVSILLFLFFRFDFSYINVAMVDSCKPFQTRFIC